MATVEGVDLDFLLEDLAHTKRRVSRLEDKLEGLESDFSMVQFKRMNQAKPCREDPINSLVGIQSRQIEPEVPRRYRG